MKSNSLTIQPIKRKLADAAAEALGGIPTRPPIVSRALATGDAAAREAFKAAHTEQAPAPLGHPLFDGSPSLSHSAQVANVRERLAAIVRLIRTEKAALAPVLTELVTHAAAVKVSENFDSVAAVKFLADLSAVVDRLLPPTETPVKEEAKSTTDL